MSEQSSVNNPETTLHCAILGSLCFPLGRWLWQLLSYPLAPCAVTLHLLLMYKNSHPLKVTSPHSKAEAALTLRQISVLFVLFFQLLGQEQGLVDVA